MYYRPDQKNYGNIVPMSSETGTTQRALGQHYFTNDNCRINLSRVDRRHNLTHPYDLTETDHYHDFVEVVFILNGLGTQVLEGNEYQVSAGDVFVLQGHQRHYFKDAGHVEIVNLMFDGINTPGLISAKIRQLEGYKALFILEPRYRGTHHFKNMLRLTRNELAAIEVILNTMFHEQQHQQEGYELILAHRLEELVILLSRHYSSIETGRANVLVRIGQVIDYIENNFQENITILALSEKACMSKRNFMRIFKGAVGMSPISYLSQVRLQKARMMLRESNDQIAIISLKCGFTNSNYFIKCFKKSYGVTPFKFRMQFKSRTGPGDIVDTTGLR